jgi:hypothetical protein
MADKKISALTGATTPLAGTEVLPIVQSGSTVKVSVANLTAGRAVSASSITVSAGAVGQVSSFSDGIAQGIVMSTASGYFGIYNPNYGDIAFRNGGNTSDTFRIAEAGNVTVGYGNLVIGTSGKGIDFSATSGTGTSELLADYEEGTWTPTIAGSTTAGTGTYSIQAASYTKVGNRLLFTAYITWSAHTGAGNMRIAGLPFTVTNNDNNYTSVSIYVDSATAFTAGNVLQARNILNSTQLIPTQYLTGGGASSQVTLPTSGGIIITGQYYV